MTEKEKELIRMIQGNDNIGQALMTTAVIILGFLKQHESFQEENAACHEVFYQMNPSYQ